jgi:general secretion pathway protein C
MLDALPDLLTRQRHARALALAAIAVLGAGLVAVLVQLVWLAVDAAAPPAPPAITGEVPLASSAPAASLSRWHLFGNALPTADNRAFANAPDTGLELLLRGVFAGDDPRDGRAIIAARDGTNERAVRAGEEVVPGVVIDSIYPDRVMLSRGGTLEALRLPQPEARAAATSDAPRGPLRNTSPAPPAPGPAASASPSFVNATGMSLGGSLASVAQSGGVQPAQLAQLAQQVVAAPVVEDGRIVGVRVQPGADAALFTRLGLQAGDIVTSVNGIALDSPARAQEIATALQASGAARVTVRRGGRVENLTVSLR